MSIDLDITNLDITNEESMTEHKTKLRVNLFKML